MNNVEHMSNEELERENLERAVREQRRKERGRIINLVKLGISIVLLVIIMGFLLRIMIMK